MDKAQQWKRGNEYAPYHPRASHVDAAYRDGWNACYEAAQAAIAQPVQPALQPLTAKTLSDAFQVFASGFDTFGNEWQDMGADEYFNAGFKAAHNIKAEKD